MKGGLFEIPNDYIARIARDHTPVYLNPGMKPANITRVFPSYFSTNSIAKESLIDRVV
jgi:hypothetical protein